LHAGRFPGRAHASGCDLLRLAQLADASAGSFADPQAQQAEHGHEREVAGVGGLAGGGEHGLELQVGEPERRSLRRH